MRETKKSDRIREDERRKIDKNDHQNYAGLISAKSNIEEL